MSKIVQVANAMISNPQNIKDVVVGDSELFFLYKDKYRWSIKYSENEYFLYFYPGNPKLSILLDAENSAEWEDIEMVHYSTKQIATAEAKQTFLDLYNLVKEKAYGIDEAFKDILSDMDL